MLPDSDREDPAVDSRAQVVAPKQMSSGLGSLMANYGSMSESEGDEEPESKLTALLSVPAAERSFSLINVTWRAITDHHYLKQ